MAEKAARARSQVSSDWRAALRDYAHDLCVLAQAGRALVFRPNPFLGGSSVSHWFTFPRPNQLIEAAINGDLTHSVGLPQDLTFAMLRDIGWNP